MNEVAHPRNDAAVFAAVEGQTVPRLFRRTAEANGERPALRWKADEGWQQWTWSEYADRACRTAALLREAGIGHGDRVAIMLRNRPEFHAVDMASYLVGATPFSVYNSSSPDQVAYVLGHSDAKMVFAEPDFAKVIESVRDELPTITRVITVADEDSGPGEPRWADLIAGATPVDLAEAADLAEPTDVATFIYTSGTTGPPKAVMLSHANICWLLESLAEVMAMPLGGIRMLSYLPMAHVAERIFTHYLPARVGAFVTTCPDPASVAAYLPEVRPEAFFGPPRIFEKTRAALIAALSATEAGAAALDRGLALGRQIFEARAQGAEVSAEVQAGYSEIDDAAFAGLRARIGLDACKVAFTGAAPPPVEVMEFFNFIGVPLFEVYGLSEDTGLMTSEVQRPRLGSVGKPIPGCSVRLLDDGEILCRGGHVFQGYFKDDEKTAEVLDGDGWLHTGDIGVIDDDGYIKIVDRKKELIITAGGKNISPANIEALLKTVPMIGQACVIGDKRPYVTAVLTLDPDVTRQWAAAKGREGSLVELANDPDVRNDIEHRISEVNEKLSNVERVKKFVLLGDEWLPDSEILTPTSKLKRRGVLALYGDQIEDMYATEVP
ncbi:MAG TPA: AMP-dependent synthetase/ligase [Acidimicrobiales bacterium]|nr:AMP-dependent synthetase/ligase [Acidimicrobiales bacterium]